MKFISWNVNGLRACVGKDFEKSFLALDADFFCLQETKMQAGQLDLEFLGYKSYWNYADKKGYSGTAIYTKHEPQSVHNGMAWLLGEEAEVHDHEGRIITLEYGNPSLDGLGEVFVICMYVPNSQNELKRLDYRMQWEDTFLKYVKALDAQKPVIFCGDLNVAHQEIDLKNPKTNHMNAGFTDEERNKFSIILNNGFCDTFRTLYPEQQTYSWWSYRFQARQKNVGWRIDYFVCSQRLMPLVKDAKIHTDIMGSDHCPIELDVFE